MTPIRLLVSDIDGTLVRKDKTLPDANRDAIRALAVDGVPTTLISARPPSGMFQLAATLGLTGPLAAFNGGTLFDPDGTIRFAHRLAAADATTALALIRAADVSVWAFAEGAWFASDIEGAHIDHERLASGIEPVARSDFSALAGRIDKIVGVSDDTALLARIEAQVQSAIGGHTTVARSQSYYLDVTHLLANKGAGIAALAGARSVDLSAVAALGDMTNDLPMFARAGLSVAMGQAPPEVQVAADAVAATNEHDGVADAILRFVRPRIGG